MATEPVTEQQLVDAATDCEVIEDVANGAADLNGTGEVPQRLGGSVKTLAKIEELGQTRIDALQASEENAETAATAAAASAVTAATLVGQAAGWVGVTDNPAVAGGKLTPILDWRKTQGKLFANGAIRALAYLTDNGDGSYNLPAELLPMLADGATVVIHAAWNYPDEPTGTFYQQSTSSGGSQPGGFELAIAAPDGPGANLLPVRGATMAFNAAGGSNMKESRWGYRRWVASMPKNGPDFPRLKYENGELRTHSVAPTTFAQPTHATIGGKTYAAGRNVLSAGVTLERITIYPGYMSEAQMDAVMAATDPNPVPALPDVIPGWVNVIRGDNGLPIVPLYCGKPGDPSRHWFENRVRSRDEIMELVGTQWRFKRAPRGLKSTLGMTAFFDAAFTEQWQVVAPAGPSGYFMDAWRSSTTFPTTSTARWSFYAQMTGGYPQYSYVVDRTAAILGSISGSEPAGLISPGATNRNGIHRFGHCLSVSGTTCRTGTDAYPVGTGSGVSALAANNVPDYFGFLAKATHVEAEPTGFQYSAELTNTSLEKVTIYGQQLSAAEFRRGLIWNEYGVRPVWCHGDSFDSLGIFADSIRMHLRRMGASYIPMMRTGNGGRGLTWHELYITAYIADKPEVADSHIIINEGGLDIGGQQNLADVAQPDLTPLTAVQTVDRIARLFGNRPFIFMESHTNLTGLSGSPDQAGAAQAGAAGSITLRPGAPSVDLTGYLVEIKSGVGVGQLRLITAYDTVTKVASISPNWTVIPAAASVYNIRRILPDVADSGTAQAGTNNSITLRVGAPGTSALNVDGCVIQITRGTGAGQLRTISAYNLATKVATVSANWTTNPDATSQYLILSPIARTRLFLNAFRDHFSAAWAATNRPLQAQFADLESYDLAVLYGVTPPSQQSDSIHLSGNGTAFEPAANGMFNYSLPAVRQGMSSGIWPDLARLAA